MVFVNKGDNDGTDNTRSNRGDPGGNSVLLPGEGYALTLSPIAKAIVAFIGGAVAFAIGLLDDGVFSQQDVGMAVIWALQTYAVWRVPNKPVAQIGGE